MAAPHVDYITPVTSDGKSLPSRQAVSAWQPTDRTTNAKEPTKSCIFYIHTMKHQAAMNSKPLQVEIYSRPSRITVDRIMNKVLEVLKLQDEAKKYFSIWLTSPQLQLQLNVDHRPCLLYKQWKELLVLYTACDYDTIQTDMPILSFQRNAFLKPEDELNITNLQIIDLLYEEAKLNVLRGMYPMKIEDIVKLAGIQAEIKESYNKDTCTEFYYKNQLVHYFPYHMVKRTMGIILPILMPPFERSLEEQLVGAHREASLSNSDKFMLRKQYLEICHHTMAHYGSVLFKGQIERKSSLVSKFFGTADRSVLVAINMNGLHIIRRTTPPETVLYLPFCEMSWKYKECNDNGEEFYSALILEFDCSDDPGKAKRLKIFSRQAPMMDNMIERITADLNCCEHKKKETGDVDEVDFAVPKLFPRKIVDHLLVCEDVIPKRTSAQVRPELNGGDGDTANDAIEMEKFRHTQV